MTLDLYIDGQLAGAVRVLGSPGSIQFLEPADLLGLLPRVRNADVVAAALSRTLPTNAGLSCFPKATKGCGRLEPDIVGIILSRDANRIDLFLAPAVRGRPRQHLPDPGGAPTLVGAADLQYALGRYGLTYTLSQRSVTGLGRAHLAIDTVHTDRFSELDRTYLRWVGDRLSLTGGLFRTSRYSFAFIDRFLGISIATTNDTRIDRATMNDTPLVVDGALSGRVEIYRDNVLLDTQQLAPGQLTLDTSRLPGGVYPVTLKVIDGSGERTETRLFARAANLPPPGETRFFVEAGTNVPFRSTGGGFLPKILSPAIRAGIDRRMGTQFALSGRIEGSTERQLIELGGTYLGRKWRASATGALTASGEQAAAVTLSGTLGRISWSLDARTVEGGNGFSFDPEQGLGRSYRQVTAFGGWNSRRLSLHLGTFWRREADGQSSWSLFPRLLWTIAQQPGRTWQLDASGNIGRSDWSARVGVRATLFGGRSSTSLFGGAEARHRDGETRIEPIGRGDWHRSLDLGTDALALRGALLREDGRTQGQIGGDLTNSRFQLSADATIRQDLDLSALFGRASTQFGIADGRLAFGSGGFTGAGIVAEAPGAPDDTRFAVRMGRLSSRPFAGEGPIFIPAQPFSQANIGINALSSGAALDTKSESAVFFPGTVKRLVRGSGRTTVIFGRLVDAAGTPLGGASIAGVLTTAETDESGYFQLEAGAEELRIRTKAGTPCTVDLSGLDLSLTFKDLGNLACRYQD